MSEEYMEILEEINATLARGNVQLARIADYLQEFIERDRVLKGFSH